MDLNEFFKMASAIELTPTERGRCRATVASSCRLEGMVSFGASERHLGVMGQGYLRELSQRSGRVRLDPQEHAAMRQSLQHYMQGASAMRDSEEEVPSADPVFLAPWWSRLFPVIASLVLLTGAVSAAAESANPGDALYSFKIIVNENLLGATKFTAEAKAEWHVERAGRRLHEAVTLAATEELTAERLAMVEDVFLVLTASVAEKVERLASEGHEDIALEIITGFEASMDAHGTVLAELRAKSKENDEQFRRFLREVRREADIVASSRARIAERMLPAGTVENVTVQSEQKAKLQVGRVRAAEKTSLDVSIGTNIRAETGRVKMKVQAAEAILHDAAAKRDAGAAIEALSLAKEGLQVAEEASLLLEVDRLREKRGGKSTESSASASVDIEVKTEVKASVSSVAPEINVPDITLP